MANDRTEILSAGGLLLSASKLLSTADIVSLGANTAGALITVVKAPGVKRYALPVYCTAQLIFGGVAFNYVNVLPIDFGDAGQNITFCALKQAFMNAAQNQIFVENLPQAGGFGTALLQGALENQDLVLYSTNNAPTLGNGSLLFTCFYVIVSLL